MKKRVFASLIALLMLLTCLAGCGQTGEGEETTVPAATTAAETSDPALNFELPATADLSIDEYVIYNFSSGSASLYTNVTMVSAGENVDVINDAIYKRNTRVEEAYGVTVSEVPYKASEQISTITALTASGDATCNLILCNMTDAATLAVAGHFYDLYDLENLSLEKAWWDASANYQLRMGDSLYFTYSEMDTTHYDAVRCMFFNKDIARTAGITDIYDTVEAGEWTLENMFEIANVVYADATGDGATADDVHPFIGVPSTSLSALLSGGGASYIQISDEGYPTAYLTTERFADVYEEIVSTMFRENFFWRGATKNVDATALFTSGHGLLLLTPLGMAKSLRAGDVEFGIIPLPKYNAEQEYYICNAPNPFALMIPSNLDKSAADESAFVLEALSYQSYNYLRPAYMDITLQGKTAKDVESNEMLNIIFSNIAYNVPLDTTINYASRINSMMVANDTAIVSYVASIKSALEADIEAYIAKYTQND